jgi:chemotaxis protein MotA
MLKDAAPGPKTDLRRGMEDIVAWSRTVYGMGKRGLEGSLARNGSADPLLSYGLTLVVSDYAQHDVRAMMETAADGSYHRACVAVEVLRAKGSHAPAFGMVSMLHGLTNDADAGGETLAVAFLSSLYGVLSARTMYIPAASRLERQVEARCVRDILVTEGMVMLARKKSPTFIWDRLNAFLQSRTRNYSNVIDGPADLGVGASATLPGERVPPRLLHGVKG